MITGHHYDFNTGRATLSDRIWYGRSRRIDHRHQSEKAQSIKRKIAFVSVERISNWIDVRRKCVITKTNHTFAESAHFEISSVERLPELFVNYNLLPVLEGCRASAKKSVR